MLHAGWLLACQARQGVPSQVAALGGIVCALALAAALLLAVGGVRAAEATATTDAAGVLHLRQALRADAADARFPGDSQTRVQALPHEWRADDAPGTIPVWYRLSFDAPAALPTPTGADSVLALLLPRACGRLAVALNGAVLYADPSDADLSGALCDEARLLPLPAALLRDKGNELDLRLVGRPLEAVTARQSAAGIEPPQIGPWPVLAERRQQRLGWQRAAVQVVGLSLSVLGVFVAAMGWLNRRDSGFIYFGLLAIAWGALTLHAGLGSGAIGPLDGQWLRAAALAPITALAVLFLLRHGGWRNLWVDRALGVQCVAMPLTLLAFSPQHAFVTATSWYALFALQLMAAAGWSVWRIAARDRTAAWRTASVVGIAGVLIVCELAAQAGLLSLAAARLAQVGLALLLLVFAFRLVQAFVDALRGAEAARLTMELRVTEATAEIERNFAQLAELRVEQVTEKERKRIAADLHDDLGAKLLTIVHTSESERIATLAREALEEMRLSVRGLTGKPVRAADAVADWRAETVARLGQAGIEADWRSPADEIEQRLAARTYVQTTRILREAVSNIIKHSGASHCKVRCAIGAEEFMLIIQDNGRGISDEMSGKLDRGQGMYSMKNRAKQMQGQCLVESGPGYGTVIRLTLPLTERAAAAAQT
jgi:two-component system, NarL family, sensor histidine kinase UhpB